MMLKTNTIDAPFLNRGDGMAKQKKDVKLTKKDFDKEREDGRKPHQKYKAYLVLQHLLRETDENHIPAFFMSTIMRSKSLLVISLIGLLVSRYLDIAFLW